MNQEVALEQLLEIWQVLSQESREELIVAAINIIAHSEQDQSSRAERALQGSSCPTD